MTEKNNIPDGHVATFRIENEIFTKYASRSSYNIFNIFAFLNKGVLFVQELSHFRRIGRFDPLLAH